VDETRQAFGIAFDSLIRWDLLNQRLNVSVSMKPTSHHEAHFPIMRPTSPSWVPLPQRFSKIQN
jgi:hypothetical protein